MKIAPDRYLSGNSVNWKNWESKLKFTTCAECHKKHGKIYDKGIEEDDIIPLHPYGLCGLPFMRTKKRELLQSSVLLVPMHNFVI